MTRRISPVAVCCSSDSLTRHCALALLEDPHVLDRDHRLVGEGLEQGYLLLVNGPGPRRVTPMTPIAAPPAASARRACFDNRGPRATSVSLVHPQIVLEGGPSQHDGARSRITSADPGSWASGRHRTRLSFYRFVARRTRLTPMNDSTVPAMPRFCSTSRWSNARQVAASRC